MKSWYATGSSTNINMQNKHDWSHNFRTLNHRWQNKLDMEMLKIKIKPQQNKKKFIISSSLSGWWADNFWNLSFFAG